MRGESYFGNVVCLFRPSKMSTILIYPLDTQEEEETMFPHLTHICWCEYHYTSNLIINNGTPFDINFKNKKQ